MGACSSTPDVKDDAVKKPSAAAAAAPAAAAVAAKPASPRSTSPRSATVAPTVELDKVAKKAAEMKAAEYKARGCQTGSSRAGVSRCSGAVDFYCLTLSSAPATCSHAQSQPTIAERSMLTWSRKAQNEWDVRVGREAGAAAAHESAMSELGFKASPLASIKPVHIDIYATAAETDTKPLGDGAKERETAAADQLERFAAAFRAHELRMAKLGFAPAARAAGAPIVVASEGALSEALVVSFALTSRPFSQCSTRPSPTTASKRCRTTRPLRCCRAMWLSARRRLRRCHATTTSRWRS